MNVNIHTVLRIKIVLGEGARGQKLTVLGRNGDSNIIGDLFKV